MSIVTQNRVSQEATSKNGGGGPCLSVNTGLLQFDSSVTEVEKYHARLVGRRDKRYILRKFSTLKNVRRCGVPIEGSKVVVKRLDGVHHVSGCKTCGSPWAEPVCAAKIRKKRGEQVEQGVTHALDTLHWSAVLVTLTIPHSAEQRLEDTLTVLTEAWRSCTGATKVKELRHALGFQGSIKSLEIMLGLRGWHPHFHLIEFYDRPLTADDLDLLHERYFKQLRSYYDKHGYSGLSPVHGVSIEEVTMHNGAAGRYISKLQDGGSLALEMTRADLKLGRAGGVVPFALLSEFEQTGDMDCIDKFNEYEQATFRRPCVRFSKGLRRKLGITDDRTDEEIAAEEVGGVDVVEFDNALYWRIIKLKLEGRLLVALNSGGHAGLVALLHQYGLERGGGWLWLDNSG